MTRIARALLLAALILVGCQPQAPNPDDAELDDSHDTYTKVVDVGASQKPIRILFGEPGAFICQGKTETAKELFAGLSRSTPYQDGYAYLDVSNAVTSYRAYFKRADIQGGREATFFFCSGAGSNLSGSGCVLAGVFPKGCFEAYVSGATLQGFDMAASAVKAAR